MDFVKIYSADWCHDCQAILSFFEKQNIDYKVINVDTDPKAIEKLKEIEHDDKHFEPNKVNFYLAESYYANKDYQDAIKRYNNIDLADAETGSQALYGKAYSYFNLKDYDNAAYSFNDFIKRFPGDKRVVDARLRLADSYYGTKDYASASKVYRDLFRAGSGEISLCLLSICTGTLQSGRYR